jgi:hypothetical protein
MHERVLLVGTVSNVSKNFSKDFRNVYKALNSLYQVETFLVESDSTDNTPAILNDFAGEFEDFTYETLGQLRRTIPERIERIRYCRNRYVEHIRAELESREWKYIFVADLDGMNSRLTANAIRSCFERDDWDVCLSNQSGGYYDILALRHPIWQPNNYYIELNRQRELSVGFPSWLKYLPSKVSRFLEDDFRKNNLIYSKMRRISPREPWLEVDSGFGGFAIYKPHIFIQYDYSKLVPSSQDSEHIDLHLKARADGKKLLINPRLINSGWNTYNLNRIFLIRQIRRLVWGLPAVHKIFSMTKSSFRKLI